MEAHEGSSVSRVEHGIPHLLSYRAGLVPPPLAHQSVNGALGSVKGIAGSLER